MDGACAVWRKWLVVVSGGRREMAARRGEDSAGSVEALSPVSRQPPIPLRRTFPSPDDLEGANEASHYRAKQKEGAGLKLSLAAPSSVRWLPSWGRLCSRMSRRLKVSVDAKVLLRRLVGSSRATFKWMRLGFR